MNAETRHVVLNDPDPDGTPHWKWRATPHDTWSREDYPTRAEAVAARDAWLEVDEQHHREVREQMGEPAEPEVCAALHNSDDARQQCEGCGERWRPVRRVRFRREPDGEVLEALWCHDCIEMADAASGPGGSWGAFASEPVYGLEVMRESSGLPLDDAREYALEMANDARNDADPKAMEIWTRLYLMLRAVTVEDEPERSRTVRHARNLLPVDLYEVLDRAAVES